MAFHPRIGGRSVVYHTFRKSPIGDLHVLRCVWEMLWPPMYPFQLARSPLSLPPITSPPPAPSGSSSMTVITAGSNIPGAPNALPPSNLPSATMLLLERQSTTAMPTGGAAASGFGPPIGAGSQSFMASLSRLGSKRGIGTSLPGINATGSATFGGSPTSGNSNGSGGSTSGGSLSGSGALLMRQMSDPTNSGGIPPLQGPMRPAGVLAPLSHRTPSMDRLMSSESKGALSPLSPFEASPMGDGIHPSGSVGSGLDRLSDMSYERLPSIGTSHTNGNGPSSRAGSSHGTNGGSGNNSGSNSRHGTPPGSAGSAPSSSFTTLSTIHSSGSPSGGTTTTVARGRGVLLAPLTVNGGGDGDDGSQVVGHNGHRPIPQSSPSATHVGSGLGPLLGAHASFSQNSSPLPSPLSKSGNQNTGSGFSTPMSSKGGTSPAGFA
jgi:hypothetical protein